MGQPEEPAFMFNEALFSFLASPQWKWPRRVLVFCAYIVTAELGEALRFPQVSACFNWVAAVMLTRTIPRVPCANSGR